MQDSLGPRMTSNRKGKARDRYRPSTECRSSDPDLLRADAAGFGEHARLPVFRRPYRRDCEIVYDFVGALGVAVFCFLTPEASALAAELSLNQRTK